VSRRLIAAADRQPRPAAASSVVWRRRAVAVVALVMLPFGAATLYLVLGSPALPDQPLAPRLVAAARANQSVDNLIARVEAHLEQKPDDGRGWEGIAGVFVRGRALCGAVEGRRPCMWRCGSS